MNKIKNIAARHSSKVKYLFLIGAIIAAINSLSRADYNFVVYLYMFYVWTFMADSAEAQRQDKIGTFYILIYSLLIDFIWCVFWGGKWDQVPTLFHEMTLFFSWLGIIWKLFVILFVGILELDIIKASIVSILNKNNKYVKYDDEQEQGI